MVRNQFNAGMCEIDRVRWYPNPTESNEAPNKGIVSSYLTVRTRSEYMGEGDIEN